MQGTDLLAARMNNRVLLVPPLQLDTNINDLRYNTGILNDKNSELTNLMATLLPSITTGLKPVAGSLSAPGLG